MINAQYSTSILRCPIEVERYTLVGSVPVALCDRDGQRPRIYDTEQEAINDLLAVGVDRFQLADCSWYQA